MIRVIPGHPQAGTPPADHLATLPTDQAAPPGAPPPPADELAGEWGELAAQAAALDGEPAASPAAQAAQLKAAAAESDQVREQWGALAAMALSMGLPLLGAFKGQRWADAYGEREQKAICKAAGDLAVSQGWSASETLGRYGPWLAFGGAVLAPVLPLILAEAAPPPELAAPVAPPADDGPTITSTDAPQ